MWKTIKRIFLGKPLATEDIDQEKLNNSNALAIFGSDALSSTAYATEEILLALALIGTAALSVAIPIALAISLLVLIVAFSYRQIVRAYPQGGGVYSVSKTNLGEFAGLLGASSLIIDYILTVAVSVAAGVAAITSAFPEIFPYRIFLAIVVVFFLMWMNLRGVKSSGRVFSFPTYLFILAMFMLIGVGFFRAFSGTLPKIHSTGNLIEEPVAILGWLLLLRAFSSGCAAITGIEAVSNGIRAFKPPESSNAAKVLLRLAIFLTTIFLGITMLSYLGGILAVEKETVLSQIARAVFGETPFYLLIQISTFLILFLAANTPFADFPRVAALQAIDGYWPKQFFTMGSRLVFSNGIIMLAVVSSILLFIFQASVHTLIPLYAVGVFLGFSLSQLGMIFHWKNKGARKNAKSLLINAIGFAATFTVFGVVFFSKFNYGAWILIPVFVALMITMGKIKSHYNMVERETVAEKAPLSGFRREKLMMVALVSEFNRLAIDAGRSVMGIQPGRMKALHIASSDEEGDNVRKRWEKEFRDIPIDVIVDNFRDPIPLILKYVSEAEQDWKKSGGEKLGITIAMIVPKNRLADFLHNHTANKIVEAIKADPNNDAQISEIHIKVP
ncbi:MAG: APC family permease [Candidatus Nealsonbacteria bacterium]|nr:APC family permease [Candidatus Nealsonbacteria bacterium]